MDRRYYLAQAGEGQNDTADLVEHYLQVGSGRKFDPSPTFRSSRYLDATPGVRETGQDPFLHYLLDTVGEATLTDTLAGLTDADVGMLRARFDADWYLRSYPDVEASGNDPFVHYLTTGWRERRDPSPSFSTGAYLDLYSDIRDSGINPFRHWVLHGIGEGRSNGKAASSLASAASLSAGERQVLTRMVDIERYQAYVADAGPDPVLPLAAHFGLDGANADKAVLSFQAARHVATYPELAGTDQEPLLHYLFAVVGEPALRELFVDKPIEVTRAICEQFDAAWYLYSYPDVEASGQDALIHYMTVGWRENRDPSQEFSTRAYLLRYPDIIEAGMHPFQHWVTFGKDEGRSGVSSARNFRNRPYTPSITAILVNDDADPLTPECVFAIAGQTYEDLSFLVVGTPLSDASRAALEARTRHARIGYLSGDGAVPLSDLLHRAAAQASGDLLWFVRGRGVHDFEFLARLTSSFADNSVQLGFGRRLEPHDTNFAVTQDELARQMEGWARHATTPAAVWFPEHLRTGRMAVDQYSFLWRRRILCDDVWHRAGDYRHLGLWHLYLHMASGGQIATVRDALMRIPAALPPMPSNDDFRSDVARLTAEVGSVWPTTHGVAGLASVSEAVKRHVLVVTHGIFAGGAENLPIQLANELAARGIIVSMLIFKVDLNPEMRATLNPGVSIYEADWVMEYGSEQFLRDIGCSLIHSHGVIGEMFFFRLSDGPLPVPYVATLHGSYEASSSSELPERFIAKIVRNVDLFIYTADKNLVPLLRHQVRPERIIKMINAMPVDEAPFPRTRAGMGIAEDAVVFTLVGRGIPEKGWSTAINAFRAVRDLNPHRPMHLCLVGEGEEPDRLKPLHADDPSISFLGFQLRIHGLYRMTDVAIVPTRFAGESFPLCIIQALQVSVPVIATDVGEIASMLEVDGVAGGVVVEGSPVDAVFDARFTEAMHGLIDDERRERISRGAGVLGRGYDMGAFTDQYVAVYERVIRDFAASRPLMAADGDTADAV
ncbi:glycosyltransferase [Sphingomonas solaris]|nr:glycosyltransferase family 4 protein [Sphingomonas solaris]